VTDARIARLAHTLVHYSIAVQPGECILLSGELSGLPLIRETHKEIVRAGGHAVVALIDEQMGDFFLRHADDAQLAWLSPLERWASEEAAARIDIRSTNNTRAGTSISPARLALRNSARRGLGKLRFARAAEKTFRWTLTQFPTDAFAQEADMSLAEFEDFVYAATFADQPDPISRWRALGADQQRYVDWLKGKRTVQVRGPHIDMTLSIAGRTFINSDGRRNMPSGEIFTGPVEDSAEGWVRFTYPAIREGRVVEGVELRFAQGRVVEARARKNEEYLLAQLDADPGARYLGEFAIGTNFGIQRFTGNILFDEKIGGTIHMALGNGYPETGSVNESAIHWDMICDMRTDAEIVVDGEVLYRNGAFTF
jgi:aminopeptidase